MMAEKLQLICGTKGSDLDIKVGCAEMLALLSIFLPRNADTFSRWFVVRSAL